MFDIKKVINIFLILLLLVLLGCSKGCKKGEDNSTEQARKHLSPVIEKYNADVVFNGHKHNYQRSYPIKDERKDNGGTVYIVTGGGGAPLYDTSIGWWTAEAIKEYNFIQVDVEGKTAKFTVYNDKGKVLDSFVLRK